MNGLRSLLVAILVLAGTSGLAQAESLAEVRDGAGLFTPDTVARVNKQLQAIQREYQRDVLIETMRELPPKEHKIVSAWSSSKEIARAFAKVGETLAEERNVNGVYILICADPAYRHVQVTVWPPTDPPLTRKNCNELRRVFVDRYSHAGANQALTEMVEELQVFVGRHLQPEPASVTWWMLDLIIAGLLLLWGGGYVLRARLNQSAEADTTAEGTTGTALPGVMGGMFGALAASWIYDKAIQEGSETIPLPRDGSVGIRGFPLTFRDGPAPGPAPDSDFAPESSAVADPETV